MASLSREFGDVAVLKDPKDLVDSGLGHGVNDGALDANDGGKCSESNLLQTRADVACDMDAEVASLNPTTVDKATNRNNDQGTSSYAQVLGASSKDVDLLASSKSVTLQFIKPSVVNGRVQVSPPVEVAEEGSKVWRNTLVGYFVGKKLPFKVVHSIAHKLWGRFGLCDVLSSENGFFLFQFATFQDACKVMDRAPWHMANRPLVLKHWQPSLPLAKEDVNKVPVWVRLYNVPFEYWTSTGLSFIASAVGCPLHADHITLARKRLSFARVCVEIDARDSLVEDFDFQCSNGMWINIRAEFEWVPIRCSSCGVFGHSVGTCPQKDKTVEGRPSKVWLPKTNAPSVTPASKSPTGEEWVIVSRKNKGKGVLMTDETMPLTEMVLEASDKVSTLGESSSTKLDVVICELKEEGEGSPMVSVLTGGVNMTATEEGKEEGECSPTVCSPKCVDCVILPDDACGRDILVSSGVVCVLGEDDLPKDSEDGVAPSEDEVSPIPISSSLASKAKDSLEKKKVGGKNKKTSGGKRGRKYHSP